MTKYNITNTLSGADLGIYEADTEAAAAKVGIAPCDFWARYVPILNRFAGWAE